MFSIGMYVKFRATNSKGETRTILGKVDKEMTSQAVVLCFEWLNGLMSMKRTRVDLDKLSKARIKLGSSCVLDGKDIVIYQYSRKKTSTGLRGYYCYYENDVDKKVFLVGEDKIVAEYQDLEITARSKFSLGEIGQSPVKFFCREQVCNYLSSVKLIPAGFNTVIGSKIELFEHQLESVHSILSQKPYRAMLADEVGLGKSIEALVVLAYAMRMRICQKALIVVPDQLEFQWLQEAKSKFSLEAQIFRVTDFIYKTNKSKIIIIGFSDYKHYQLDYLGNNWDFVIIDEAHRSLHDKALYNGILKMSKNAEHFLMLSATPILQRQQEYYDLLKLLYPGVYGKITYSSFEKIMQKRDVIKEKVLYLANNLANYYEYSLEAEYIEILREIGTTINEEFVNSILSGIADFSAEKKYECISILIRYLQNTYELDQKFIRHRRSSILDPSSKRELKDSVAIQSVNYTNGLYEKDFINYTIDELERNLYSKSISLDDTIEIGRAIFSSMEATRRTITDKDYESKFPDTMKLIESMAKKERDSSMNSKINRLIEMIDSGYFGSNDKIIIFSDYSYTADIIEARLAKEYSQSSVVKFVSGMSSAQMQIAANRFQHEKKCRFLVCDKSGGEGRNFQYAEYIVHYDTPWSPAEVEQRIGRLDRIGRRPNHTVKNVVFYFNDTIEEDMFILLNNCLNVYEESLCGIEIVFDDMNNMIRDSIGNGIRTGLEGLTDPISQLKQLTENQITNEEIALLIKQSDDDYRNMEEEIVSSFSEEKQEIFQNALSSWIKEERLGTVSKQESPYRLTCFKMDSDAKMAKYGSQEGTFYVKDALMYEDVPLFTMDTPFIDCLSKEISSDEESKVCAIEIHNCGFKWTGYIFTWQLKLYIEDNLGKGCVLGGDYSIANDYILKNRISIAQSLADSEEMDADYLLSTVQEKMKTRDLLIMNKGNISQVTDYADVDVDFIEALKKSQKSYLELQKSQLALNKLDSVIEKQLFECILNEQIGKDNGGDEQKLQILKALRIAMDKFAGELDSILFINIKD